MKVSTPLLTAVMMMSILQANAQSDNATTDQNPRHLVSQAKYESVSDSINRLHSTTLQNTYVAYDWYDARQQRRGDRTAFRRQLQLERARNNYGWGYQPYDNGWNRYDGYNNRYRSARNPFFSFNNWCW